MIALNVCVSGFTQGHGRTHGIYRLHEELLRRGHNNGVHRRVWYCRWKEDWRRMAQHVEMIGLFHNEEVAVAAHGYSYGGGYGAIQLARELRRLGLSVRFLNLCDAVYRSRFLATRWVALMQRELPLLPSPTIRIPPNVDEVFAFHQRVNRPQGHRIVADAPTVLHPSVELHREHSAMDHAPEFHGRAIELAERLAAEAMPGVATKQAA